MEILMYKVFHSLMNLLVSFITICAIFVSAYTFLGYYIDFPFTVYDAESVPYHRWQTVRLAVLITISYFALLHLFRGSKEYYPIQFMEIYLKILTVVGLIVFYNSNVENFKYFILLFFGITAIILHLARRKKTQIFCKKT